MVLQALEKLFYMIYVYNRTDKTMKRFIIWIYKVYEQCKTKYSAMQLQNKDGTEKK